ncbi:monooxygenase, partial [Ferrovibrio sp.]|uniref:monooxygenase n=1 Tax=Ferrovibrio sp. TaxID=1917215 RepID=UPI0026121C5A
LKDIQRQILQFLGPQVMQEFLRWMLPALRPEEAVGLLGGIRATAPAAGWAAIWNLAHRVLPPEKLHHLANRLGEAAPARELALLQIDFPFAGPWGDDLALALRDLAEAIAATPGLLWKIWTENPETGRAGGIYLFTGKADAEVYLDLHSKRLAGFGIDGIAARLFGVNEALGRINRAPLAPT